MMFGCLHDWLNSRQLVSSIFSHLFDRYRSRTFSPQWPLGKETDACKGGRGKSRRIPMCLTEPGNWNPGRKQQYLL